jgi:hypothetical protein
VNARFLSVSIRFLSVKGRFAAIVSKVTSVFAPGRKGLSAGAVRCGCRIYSLGVMVLCASGFSAAWAGNGEGM